MPTETKEEKIEKTFLEKVAAKGYQGRYNAAEIQDLENPNVLYASFGICDADGAKQVMITMPRYKWAELVEYYARTYLKK